MRPRSQKSGCEPLGAMIFSYATPGYGKPSLLNFAEVQEFLRSMGSMLVHILSEANWSDLSGKNGLELDVMDVTSNFMMQW